VFCADTDVPWDDVEPDDPPVSQRKFYIMLQLDAVGVAWL